MSGIEIEWLGDSALLLRIGEHADIKINAQVHAAARALRAAGIPGVRDIVPAYASIAVHYDAREWLNVADAAAGESNIERLLKIVQVSSFSEDRASPAEIEIPVCYGGEFGADIDAVARAAQLTLDEVIARHTEADYHVAMLGFAPGFPYLLGLDARLHTARRAQPRTRVPAGSVAIGGAQTGIYPRELPGGWQIIGRTPLSLFDATRNPPALLAPGQTVRFRAIDTDEFAALAG